MMRIKDEQQLADAYGIICYPDTIDMRGSRGLPMLTADNVAKVEACLRLDSGYRRAFDPKAGPANKYGGSTAYWLTVLKSQQENAVLDDLMYGDRKVMDELVAAIDRDNSTHLNTTTATSELKSENTGNNRVPVGRAILSRRICKFANTVGKLKQLLREDDLDDKGIFWNLAQRIEDKELTSEKICDERGNCLKELQHGRSNISFASKFCHYASFYLFNDEFQDKYSIYDRDVASVLPDYLKRHKVMTEQISFLNNKGEQNLGLYKRYSDAIAKLLAVDEKDGISRNGFDHLLWYYFKG